MQRFIMKSRLITGTVLSLFIAVTLASSKPAHAADVTVGVSSWYVWWKMNPSAETTLKPGLLYGPALGFDFAEKWSISSVFITGELSESASGYSFYYRRYDSDTVVSYKITRWLKLFAGFKYYRYDFNDEGNSIHPFGNADYHFYSRGPGAGVGLTLPLADSLFLLTNVSGLYCFAVSTGDNGSNYSRERGINTSISLAYHITPASTTLSGGFRYQYIANHDKTTDFVSKTYYYGVTFAALYHFSLDDD
jgi:hypothetical protein